MKGWIIFFLVLFVSLAIYFSLIVFQGQTYRTNLIVLENLKAASNIESVYKSMKASLHLSIIKAWNSSKDQQEIKAKTEEYLNIYLQKIKERSKLNIMGLPIKIEKIEEKNDEIYVETSVIEIKIDNPKISKKTNLNASIEKRYLTYKYSLQDVLNIINNNIQDICNTNIKKYYGQIDCLESCSKFEENAKSLKESEIKSKIKDIAKSNSNKDTFIEIEVNNININDVSFQENIITDESNNCIYKECYVLSISFEIDLKASASNRGTVLELLNSENLNKFYSC
ncbi:MAG: hypothetical protein QXJ14_03560 [Candidatus Aenigmatarchaeota archaeon]